MQGLVNPQIVPRSCRYDSAQAFFAVACGVSALMQTEGGVELPTAEEYRVFPVSPDFVRYFAVRQR